MGAGPGGLRQEACTFPGGIKGGPGPEGWPRIPAPDPREPDCRPVCPRRQDDLTLPGENLEAKHFKEL